MDITEKRQAFAEQVVVPAWSPSHSDTRRIARWQERLLGHSAHNIEYDAGPGTSGHIRYFTFDTLERVLRRAGLRPPGQGTNVAHFSVLGSSELIGRVWPTLGHTLISIARE
jgi:hypothetical protein